MAASRVSDIRLPTRHTATLPGAKIFERPGQMQLRFCQQLPVFFRAAAGACIPDYAQDRIARRHWNLLRPDGQLEMWSLRLGSDDRYGPATHMALPITQLQDGCRLHRYGRTKIRDRYRNRQAAVFMTSIDRHAGYPPRQLMWSVGIQRELYQGFERGGFLRWQPRGMVECQRNVLQTPTG